MACNGTALLYFYFLHSIAETSESLYMAVTRACHLDVADNERQMTQHAGLSPYRLWMFPSYRLY
jgi:hypothetical protein